MWFKRGRKLSSPQLGSNYNKFAMLSRITENISCYNLNRNILREVIVKIGLERIDIQKEVIVEVLLYSSVIYSLISILVA